MIVLSLFKQLIQYFLYKNNVFVRVSGHILFNDRELGCEIRVSEYWINPILMKEDFPLNRKRPYIFILTVN
jgi:hypothetical protein